MQELRLEDEGSFYNYLRMKPEMFDELLQSDGSRICKHNEALQVFIDSSSNESEALSWRFNGCRGRRMEAQRSPQSSFSARYWSPKGGTKEAEALPRMKERDVAPW